MISAKSINFDFEMDRSVHRKCDLTSITSFGARTTRCLENDILKQKKLYKIVQKLTSTAVSDKRKKKIDKTELT